LSNEVRYLIELRWMSAQFVSELNKYKKDVETMSDNKMLNQVDIPLNQILFGSPGTGKIYHSITAAVKAAELE